jgi:hypothetical protein
VAGCAAIAWEAAATMVRRLLIYLGIGLLTILAVLVLVWFLSVYVGL